MKLTALKPLGFLLISALIALPAWTVAKEQAAEAKTAGAEQVAEHAKWSYQDRTGPKYWALLSDEYRMCHEGKNQSPINISTAVPSKLKGIRFEYNMLVPENIVNNGHTIQVNIRSGGKITIDEKPYFLKQFHFHTPSEHRIDGTSYPLEAHFVHVSEDNQIAVVSLLYRPGPANTALDALLKNMPFNVGETKRSGVRDLELFERDKVVKNYFRYSGSLTTPPCTEGVIWIVMQTRSNVNKLQLEAFQYALKHPNNRPVQPLNGRVVVKKIPTAK